MNKDTYLQLYQESIDNPELFWQKQAEHYLSWDKPWEDVLIGSLVDHNVRWFSGGRLNASVNCLDRHLATYAQKTAIIWQGDQPDQSRSITYQELYQEVCQFANVLIAQGVKKGDRICIYLPMIPEIIVAMLACARIGAIHSVIFAGFSSHALQQRILDAGARLIITADQAIRGGKVIPLKEKVDEALMNCTHVDKVIIVKCSNININCQADTDLWYHELMASVSQICDPVSMDANDPLFILYTSGSTGSPKGILHSTAGYLLYVALTFKVVFNYQSEDIFWCTADIGWITGHSYLVYGPLLNAATIVMHSGIPTFPTPARYWQVIDKYKVNILYTSPTVIRALMREGEQYVKETSRQSLKLLGSVGEPLNPEAWRWYFEVVGESRCPIIDTWWQTETGGIMLTPFPEITSSKPGSVGWPFFGVLPAIFDQEYPPQKHSKGELVISKPWPGMLQTIYGNPKRFVGAYFQKFPGYYFTGDGAECDEEGYYWITGRVDDVLNVSGHRLGSAEIENALVAHPKVAEAAVVDCPHPIKGQGIYAFVTLLKGEVADLSLENELKDWVRNEIGAIAIPEKIHWANELPKTRSGKIMRRILRQIAHHQLNDFGDISTLSNPEAIQELIRDSWPLRLT